MFLFIPIDLDCVEPWSEKKKKTFYSNQQLTKTLILARVVMLSPVLNFYQHPHMCPEQASEK